MTDYHRLGDLAAAVRAVVPDAAWRARMYSAGNDPEVRRLALGALRDEGG